MADNSAQTPVIGVVRTSRPSSILRTLPHGTPFRTPDRRRFGPLGSSWRTPISRITAKAKTRLSTSSPLSQGSSRPRQLQEVLERTEQEEENIKAMTKKVWQVFRLTPLYNFQKKKSDLQHYSRSLSSHVAAENKRGIFIDSTEPGDAVVGTFSGLDVGIDDPKAILIEVKGKAKNKEEEMVICQAVMFSTDLEFNPLKPSLQESFTYYSSLLIRGPQTVSQTVQNWLEVQFDCKVVQQRFTSHELVFMVSMFTGLGEVHKPVELVYGVPQEVEGLSHIDYSTKAEDCKRLWERIRGSEEDTFTSEEAQKFIAGLESHFYECFNIKLNAMPLQTVGTSVAFVGRDGKLKFYTKSTVNVLKVCRHLTDLALDQLKCT